MADTQTIRALPAGDVALAEIDRAQGEITAVVRHVLAARVASGYLDVNAAEIAYLARKIALESRLALKYLTFHVHQAARNYGTPDDAHEMPTQPITMPWSARTKP